MKHYKPLIHFAERFLYTAAQCLFLLTIGVWIRKHRHRLIAVSRVLGYTTRRPALPPMTVPELLGSGVAIHMREPAFAAWNVSPLELAVLNALVVNLTPRRIFEIGTFDGRTTLNLAANAPADARVWTLDLPPEAQALASQNVEAGQIFRGSDVEQKITQLYGDSFEFDFSDYVDKMDFVFIDAGHAYENVVNDSRIALELIGQRSGLIVWHDYNGSFEGVTRAVDELRHVVNQPSMFVRVEGTTLACLRLESSQ